MSSTTLDVPDVGPSPPSQAGTKGRSWLWVRVTLAVLLIGTSAGVRWVRAGRFAELVEAGEKPPFPMEDIPMVLGPWKGEDAKLDSEIARVTGASGMASRVYVDQRTGVKLSVIVLYGPATKVYIHSPEVCYPGTGFRQAEGPIIQQISAGKRKIPFASLLYEKGFGSVLDRHQVYYSWYYGGQWSPAMLKQKQVDRLPGMFKVHIDRLAGAREQIETDDPCVDFLELLLVDLQQRIDKASAQAPQ